MAEHDVTHQRPHAFTLRGLLLLVAVSGLAIPTLILPWMLRAGIASNETAGIEYHLD